MRRHHRCFPSFLPICIILAVAAYVIAGKAPAAHAVENLSPAQHLFFKGDWLAAADAAAKTDSADGYALAARAVLTHGATANGADAQHRAIAQALSYLDRAFEIDPDNVNAHIQSAAAFGFRAQMNRDAGDARTSRRHIDRALFLAPDNPYALAALGYWHGRTVLGAGSFIARLMFGAKRGAAVDAFERALDEAPDDAAIRIGFGRMLLRFNKKDLADQGLRELAQAVSSQPPHSALEKLLFAHAHRLLDARENGASWQDLRHMADAMAPYSGSK